MRSPRFLNLTRVRSVAYRPNSNETARQYKHLQLKSLTTCVPQEPRIRDLHGAYAPRPTPPTWRACDRSPARSSRRFALVRIGAGPSGFPLCFFSPLQHSSTAEAHQMSLFDSAEKSSSYRPGVIEQCVVGWVSSLSAWPACAVAAIANGRSIVAMGLRL